MSIFTIAEPLVNVTCCACGVPFALSQSFYNKRREDHASFFCPNGHSQHFTGETEAQKLQRQLNAAIQSRDAAFAREATARKEAEHFRQSRNVVKGHMTRLKHRVHNGVCPCCQRTFDNLARHMKTKHPDFTKA